MAISIIAIGVVIPLVFLVGGAAVFIWYTERKRKQAMTICEIPHRPRTMSFLYRRKEPFIEDGIEVCSHNPSLSKNGPPTLDFQFQHELPTLKVGDGRSDSAVQSPTETLDELPELEGTLGNQLWKRPSKAKLRHSSDEQRFKPIVRKEIPNRKSLQPHERYYARYSLQPISTTTVNDRVNLNGSDKETLNAELRDETNSPTISAVSEVSGRPLKSLSSDVQGDIPAWIRRMSVQEMAEKSWRVDGETSSPIGMPKHGAGYI